MAFEPTNMQRSDIPWIPPWAAFSSLVTPLFDLGRAALDSEGKVRER